MKPYNRQWLMIAILMCFLGMPWPVLAEIQVQAIFPNKALLMIDGKKRFLTTGESSPEGVKLISAEGEQVIVEIDGRRSVQRMGAPASISAEYSRRAEEIVRLYPTRNGMYLTKGRVNNTRIDFLVDTGATFVALNANQARRAGLDYRKGERVRVATASKIESAYKIKLNKVQVGGIELRNVDAIVHNGAFPDIALLGMSFLNRLDIEREGMEMVLKYRR